jgi:hypothetical protein
MGSRWARRWSKERLLLERKGEESMHAAWVRVDDEIGGEDEKAWRCGCRWKRFG